jgi:polygalacturonase
MLLLGPLTLAQTYSVVRFGAKADGKTLNTRAIQQAIDAASRAGGGTVDVPAGRFVTGTLYLKSHVRLFLGPGAVLLGSPNPGDYPEIGSKTLMDVPRSVDPAAQIRHDQSRFALLFAEKQEHITIDGPGTIDGNGAATRVNTSAENNHRPISVYLIACRNVVVQQVTLRNSLFWNQYYLGCDGVRITGIRVDNLENFNNDGIDIESRNVTISDCQIDCDDDAICLKSNYYWPVENVTITNCHIRTNCNGIKTGTASLGGFRNITISNCTISAASRDKLRFWDKNLRYVDQPRTVIAGLALEVVDGGVMDGVTVQNVVMRDVQTPIFIKLGNRARKEKPTDPDRPPGQLRNVFISHIVAESHSRMTSSITGFPGHYVENVTLRDISFTGPGKGAIDAASRVMPENERAYPENRMFGPELPAYGLWARHVRGLTLDNIHLAVREPDARPALVLDDVVDPDLNRIKAAPSIDGQVGVLVNGKAHKSE